jgi:hypothetical protein
MSILPENSLGFRTVEEAVGDKAGEYLKKAFENVYKYHEIDKELAQGRSNFQLEKFALLETYTLESAYESVIKSRRQMAEGLMDKLLSMQQKVREFEYKWNDVEDKSKPIKWDCNGDGPNGGGTKLCWFDLDQLQLEHFLRSSELEVRDRLYQIEHLDKMLEELTIRNGNKPVDRAQWQAMESEYWKVRFSEQILDENLSSHLNCSLGNIHSVRRSTAPELVDPRSKFEDFPSLGEALSSPEGRMKFISDLERNVIRGYEDVMGVDLGAGNYLPPEERKKMVEEKMENFNQQLALKEAQKQERLKELKVKEQQQISGSPENAEIVEE